MKKEQFESFLSSHEKRIYNYIWTLVHHEADAQDLVQVSFLAFYEHIDGIDEATALSYLYRIAHNKSMTLLKARSKMIPRDPEVFARIPQSNPAPAQDYSDLQAAIASLPVKLSTVIHLQYYEQLPYKEIALKLGTSVKAVESLLVRAKKLLRKKMMQGMD